MGIVLRAEVLCDNRGGRPRLTRNRIVLAVSADVKATLEEEEDTVVSVPYSY